MRAHDGYWVKPRTTAQTNQFVAMFGISLLPMASHMKVRTTREKRACVVLRDASMAWGRFIAVALARDAAPTQCARLEPRRRVDRGLALLLGLGHAPVVELARHAGLLRAAHGCKRVSGTSARRVDGAVRRFRVDLRLLSASGEARTRKQTVAADQFEAIRRQWS